MPNITLSVPSEIYSEMKMYKEIRWSEIAREAIINRLDAIKYVEKITKKRKITKTDVKKLGRKLKVISRRKKSVQ